MDALLKNAQPGERPADLADDPRATTPIIR